MSRLRPASSESDDDAWNSRANGEHESFRPATAKRTVTRSQRSDKVPEYYMFLAKRLLIVPIFFIQIRPDGFCALDALFKAPFFNVGMVAGKKDVGNFKAHEFVRPCILRIFEEII